MKGGSISPLELNRSSSIQEPDKRGTICESGSWLLATLWMFDMVINTPLNCSKKFEN